MEITAISRIMDIFSLPEFAPMRGQFIASASNWFSGGKDEMTLAELGRTQPAWPVQDMVTGLLRLQVIAGREKDYVFPLQEGNPARLIFMPADQKVHAAFFLLLAGGGYGAVCTLAEALPVAARLNALGYDCWCLNYRTATPETMVHGLMPAPLEDIASALQWIFEKHGQAPYSMVGFSAGANACALWGTGHAGARHYSLPQPEVLLLDYPLSSLRNLPGGPVRELMMQGLFGTGYNDQIVSEYSVECHVDTCYPPAWIEKAADDTTIPAKDTESLINALKEKHTPYFCELAASGGHGFGLGSGTPAEGWVDRAIDWYKSGFER